MEVIPVKKCFSLCISEIRNEFLKIENISSAQKNINVVFWSINNGHSKK